MLKRLLYVIAVGSLATGIVLLISAMSGGQSEGPPLAIGTPLPTRVPPSTTTPLATREATPGATLSPTPQGDPRLAALAINRLVIPKIGVDAPIVVLGLLSNGAMASPAGPEEVAWYDFSAKPGQIGNVVLSGHLDYINYGGAVFWFLNELRPGDEISLVMEDNTKVTYIVQTVQEYEEATAPIQDIVGPTASEAITLITCSGSFDTSSRHYDRRLVVRGTRKLPTGYGS